MLTRDEAFELLKKNLRTENLIKHSLAVEAILEDMAKKLGEDPQIWGLTGLLHDLDYDFTKEEPQKHSQITVKVLADLLPLESINAIKAHNYQLASLAGATSCAFL